MHISGYDVLPVGVMHHHFDGLMQDCVSSSALTMELLQSSAKQGFGVDHRLSCSYAWHYTYVSALILRMNHIERMVCMKLHATEKILLVEISF